MVLTPTYHLGNLRMIHSSLEDNLEEKGCNKSNREKVPGV
jgi:hypothetical protein